MSNNINPEQLREMARAASRPGTGWVEFRDTINNPALTIALVDRLVGHAMLLDKWDQEVDHGHYLGLAMKTPLLREEPKHD